LINARNASWAIACKPPQQGSLQGPMRRNTQVGRDTKALGRERVPYLAIFVSHRSVDRQRIWHERVNLLVSGRLGWKERSGELVDCGHGGKVATALSSDEQH
jgi:hypothetical protein